MQNFPLRCFYGESDNAIKESKGTKSEAASSQCQFKLPGDIVRKGDLDNIVNEIKITLKNDMPKVEVPPPTVTVCPMTVLEKSEYADNTAKTVNKEVTVLLRDMRNSVEGNNRRMDRIEKQLPAFGELARLRLIKWILVSSHAFLSILIVVGVVIYHNDIEHLKRVEWLYRSSRIGQEDTEEYQDFERRMLQGTKEEREDMKSQIFNLERKAPQFIYFKPSDDWQPEPKEEEPSREQEPTEKTSSEQKPAQHKPLPHEQKSRLTPGEIEAIKQMRANPHIPEDAKPDLPEGYE